MGYWGTGLYDNDMAADVKGRFDELIREHRSEVTAAEILESEFSEQLGCEYDRFLFYTALADTQWDWGRLMDHVRETALCLLDTSDDSQLFADPEEAKERIRVLGLLKEKLKSEPPTPKRIVNRRCYRCEWKIGDTFSLPLVSETARALGLFNSMLLIRKVGETMWYPHHIIPIVCFKLIKSGSETITCDEYTEAEYVQISYQNYSERFFPIDGRDPKGDIDRKSKIRFVTDEFGLLPIYRASVIITNIKQIPGDLKYQGNFAEAPMPANEFVPFSDLNLCAFHFRDSEGSSLEDVVLQRYQMYNLRQHKLYLKL